MCLYLTNDSARLRKNYRRRKKHIIVYKVLEKYRGKVYAPYQGNCYPKEGLMMSFRGSAKIDNLERNLREVNEGLHFFLTKQNAKNEILRWKGFRNSKASRLVIYKAKVDPKDVVAIGYFEDQLTLVAIKATMIGEA